jgi:alpha-beta hydrolase superfamily lysophospholipase
MRLPLLVLVALFSCSGPESSRQPEEGLDFEALASAFPRATPEESFVARDGVELPFRYYDGRASTDLILLHGSGAHSLYLSDMAAAIATAGVADVYTPDLRGHGRKPRRRGDIDYIDQLEDDIADLISFIRRRDSKSAVILGGHSSGGGLAIRIAGGGAAARADAYLFLAPFLEHDAPTVRPRSGGWAHPKISKIILLDLLNRVGITAFNGATVLEFDLPASRRSGFETPAYTYRLMNGFAPRDYRSDISAMCEPALVLVGSDDEAFYSDQFAPVFSKFAPQARVELVPGVGHLGLVAAPQVRDAVVSWVRELSAGRPTERCR